MSRRRAWLPRRRGRLATRLEDHVRTRLGVPGVAWWAPPPRSSRVARWSGRRAWTLAQVCERLALLVTLGHPPTAAVRRVAEVCGGPIAAEVAWLAGTLQGGARLAPAVGAWARRAGCPDVGLLAAALRGCSSAGDVATAFDRRAAALTDRALAQRLRWLGLKVCVVWLAGGATAALSVAAAVR